MAKTLTEALEAIRDIRYETGADDLELIGIIERMQSIASAALEGDDWTWPSDLIGGLCSIGGCDADDVESTYCGSFCDEHLREHVEECEVCARDFQPCVDDDERSNGPRR